MVQLGVFITGIRILFHNFLTFHMSPPNNEKGSLFLEAFEQVFAFWVKSPN